MNRAKILGYFVLVFLFILQIKSESKPSFTLEIGGSLLYNSYKGNFNGFPNYDCCGHFTKGKGLGFEFSATGIYKSIFSSNFLNINYFSSMSLRNLSGKFEYDEYFADIIIDETIAKGISRHRLETDILSLALLPGFEFDNLFGIKPLSFRLAGIISIPLKNNFYQEEKLISPEKALFENHQKQRNVFNAKINNFRIPQLGLNFNIGWKIPLKNNFYLFPNLFFEKPFGTLVKNLDLNTHHIALGVKIGYNIPKPKPQPPSIPPQPEFPNPIEPKEVKPVVSEILVLNRTDMKYIKNKDTIYITRKINQTVELSPTPTTLFYQRNDFLFGEDSIETRLEYQKFYEENRKILQAVVDYLRKNPDEKISLVCSQTNDEQSNICDLRLARLTEYFRVQGLENRIENIKKIISTPKKAIPELLEEERNVQIIFSNGVNLVYRESVVSSDTNEIKPSLKLLVKVQPETNFKVNGNVIYQNNLYNFTSDSVELPFLNPQTLTATTLDSMSVTALIETDEELPQKIEDSSRFYFKLQEFVQKDKRFFTPKSEGNFILASLFKFDETIPYWTNPKLKEIVTDLITKGKSVQIIGSVDNIGTETHNKKLATERAKGILKILGKNLPIKTIDLENQSPNQTPYTRILNRSAWIYFE
ncbi:MAG: hypothetical protein CH6_3851 [Candidatus Kapaibacterium sp.]|nr:MAG: hypothetical protein CH6_3851 [Candidatus Kapabacteria bacterium]